MGLQGGKAAPDVVTADTSAHGRRCHAGRSPARGVSRHAALPQLPAQPAEAMIPVPLLCPKCGKPVNGDSICATTGEPCMSLHQGIPRFLFGQKYWGEISSEKMRQLLHQRGQAI